MPKQTKPAKRSLQLPPRRRVFFITAITVLLFVAVLQVAFVVAIFRAKRWVYMVGAEQSVTQLIVDAVDGLHKPAPVDGPTGKVYMPDARLVLPPANIATEIFYSNVGDSQTPELQITARYIVGQAKAKLRSAQQQPNYSGSVRGIFEHVPELQACSRGVQLYFSKPNLDSAQFTDHGTKQLADGRTVYLYTEPLCQADMTDLVAYIKQAQSY